MCVFERGGHSELVQPDVFWSVILGHKTLSVFGLHTVLFSVGGKWNDTGHGLFSYHLYFPLNLGNQ